MSDKKPSTERCAACGERRPKTALALLVGDPAGSLIVDLKGKLGDRGAFVCLNRGCLDRLEVDDLARATGVDRLDPRAAAAIPELIGTALASRVKSLLGLAQRSGRLVSGTDAAKAALRRDPPSVWLAIVAEDASPEISRRLCRTAQAHGVTVARCLTTAELGDSLGKSLRSIVAIEDAGLARAIRETLSQLEAVSGREYLLQTPPS